jgi:flagellar biosynthesis/type III secretory pathway chaperone
MILSGLLPKDWVPSAITGAGGLMLWALAVTTKGRAGKALAAKNYSEKVFQEMTALFDELKEKAREAEDRASSASLAAQEAQKRAQEAQATVTEAHASVSAAQASAQQAQQAATDAQRMVSEGFAREGENQRQLTAAWDKIDSLTERVRVMENANSALMGGAIGLDPLRRSDADPARRSEGEAAHGRRRKAIPAPDETDKETDQ